jgi:hypothetical protein
MGIAAQVGCARDDSQCTQVMCKMPLHVVAGYATFRKQKPPPRMNGTGLVEQQRGNKMDDSTDGQ